MEEFMTNEGYSELVAEEINMYLNLNTKVLDRGKIEVDTIAGKMLFSPFCGELMQDVYTFIHHYGLRMSNYGLENKLKERSNEK